MPLALSIFQCRPAALVSRHPLRSFRSHKTGLIRPRLSSLLFYMKIPNLQAFYQKKPVNPVIFSWIFIFYLADSTFSGKLASLPAS